MCIKYLLTIIIYSLAFIGLANSNEKDSNNSPYKIYVMAKNQLQVGNWKKAINSLETLENFYPFNPYFQQVQLDLVYAYYKNNDFSSARRTIDRFMRLNPTHPRSDYLIYISGLINMRLDFNPLASFFGIDFSDRDPSHARDAFNDFSRLVKIYPTSKYISDSKKYLSFLQERLAKYEYSIASYYTHRGAWVAVVNRIEKMLYNYPNTQATRNGLHLMHNAYRKMQMKNQADKVSKIIAMNDRTS